ncbi:MAG: DUF1287 domain-containing protein [Pyrinomonadaceae bacterium]
MFGSKKSLLLSVAGLLVVLTGCASIPSFASINVERPKIDEIDNPKVQRVLKNAFAQIDTVTGYTQKYFVIDYPNGDVPSETGACTDVVIRALRAADLDLQKAVHEDMSMDFSAYPQKWGLEKPDTNIDHRRVPNLDKYFQRKGKSLKIGTKGDDFKPGDIVAWDINGKGMTHIGVVSNIWNKTEARYLVIHNIGNGVHLEDRLFDWTLIGHYRYF